jgi:peptidyl-prolyl cis-trans isomerase SurA
MSRIGKFMIVLVLLLTPICSIRASAEVIDRILAVVNRQIITLSDLEQEQKFQATDRGDLPAIQNSSEGQRQVEFELTQKLIEQNLIRQQVQQFPGIDISSEEIEKQMAFLIKENGSSPEWEQKMMQLQLTPEEVREHVRWQLQVMKFFDYRFRQFVVVDSREIEEYYREKFLPELAMKAIGRQPSLGEVEEKIRAILAEEKLNLRIDDWLKSLRESASIEIFD